MEVSQVIHKASNTVRYVKYYNLELLYYSFEGKYFYNIYYSSRNLFTNIYNLFCDPQIFYFIYRFFINGLWP